MAALPCVGPAGRAGLISRMLRDGLGDEQEAGLIGWLSYGLKRTNTLLGQEVQILRYKSLMLRRAGSDKQKGT